MPELIGKVSSTEEAHQAHLVAARHKDTRYPVKELLSVRLDNVLPGRSSQHPRIWYADIPESLHHWSQMASMGEP